MNFLNNRFKIGLYLYTFVILIIYAKVSFGFYEYYETNPNSSNSIAVTGDSYAGFLASFESYKNHNIYVYAVAGRPIKMNYDIMMTAIDSPSNYMVVSIGVNDYVAQTNIDEFKLLLDQFVVLCEERQKKVIFHTYMDFDKAMIEAVMPEDYFVFKISDYDNSIKEVVNQHKNAYYINMSDYNDQVYLQEDRIHFNSIFYDELYDRISMRILLF